MLLWPSLPPVPPSRGLVLHGALLWEGLCKQQAWRPARAAVPLPSGSSSDRLPQWCGRLAQGTTGLARFRWLARLLWPLLPPLPLPLPMPLPLPPASLLLAPSPTVAVESARSLEAAPLRLWALLWQVAALQLEVAMGWTAVEAVPEMQVKMRQQWARRVAPGRLTMQVVPARFEHGWAHPGLPLPWAAAGSST